MIGIIAAMDEELAPLLRMADGAAGKCICADEKLSEDISAEADIRKRSILKAVSACKRIRMSDSADFDAQCLIKRGVLERVEKNGFTFFKGKINGRDCVFAESGIGKVNAAACTQTLIDVFGAECIINCGSAGSLDAGASYGDVVIAEECVQWDFDLTVFGHSEGFIPSCGRFFSTDSSLLKLCRDIPEFLADFGFKCLIGKIASADSFVSNEDKKLHLRSEFSALCTDMESASVTMVCSLSGVPCICVRGISDNASEEAGSHEFYSNLNLASGNCAVFVYIIVSSLDC